MQGISWSDLYGDSPMQEVELDKGGKALLSLVPEEKQAEAEPVLRTFLSQMRIQLGDERKYLAFCDDMVRATELHREGKRQDALTLFGVYGWGGIYEMFLQQVDEQEQQQTNG